MSCAYSQSKLHAETRQLCIFNVISDAATCTNQFMTGFYGLTDMPSMFQMSLDTTILYLTNIFSFLDYPIVYSSDGNEDHHIKVES